MRNFLDVSMLSVSGSHFGFPETMPHPRVLEAMQAALPLNVNSYGMHTRRALGEADSGHPRHPHRALEVAVIERVAKLLRLSPSPAGYVCSGATEGNLLACVVAATASRDVERYAVVTTELTHSSVRKGIRFTGLLDRPNTVSVSIPSGSKGPKTLKKMLVELKGQGVEAVGLFTTWVDPLTARTDDMLGLNQVLLDGPLHGDLFIDAAYPGLLYPALGLSNLQDVTPSVVAVDFYKTVFAPIGVGLTLLSRRSAELLVASESYLPYGEERTLLGSRNFAHVVVAEVVLELIADGSVAEAYAPVQSRFEYACRCLSDILLDAAFPILAIQLPNTLCTPEVVRKLAQFDLYGVSMEGDAQRFRLCLAPHQNKKALKELINFLADVTQ